MYVNKIFDPVHSKVFIWDTDVLDWVAWDGSVTGGTGGDGGDVTVLNWPASQTVDDGGTSLTVDGALTIEKTSGLAIRVDEASATITYIGEALPGAAEASSVWRIKKMDTTAGISIKWAGGADAWTNRWDQRTSLTYT